MRTTTRETSERKVANVWNGKANIKELFVCQNSNQKKICNE